MQDRNAVRPETSTTRQRAVPQTSSPERTQHGSSAWSLPSRRPAGVQPQDGSLTVLARVAPPARPGGGKLAGESDDSRITGGTRSLSRRVLGLNNVTADKRKTPRATSALPAPVA